MKSIQELESIRQLTLDKMNLRNAYKDGVRVVVGLATCGIAAGAKPVIEAFENEVKERGLNNVMVLQTGCIGMCRLEPMVEVFFPGKEKVTYCKVTPEQVKRIVSDHLVGGEPVAEYAIGSYE
jgi:NADP-reducing hydrogenase subunit HndB